MPFLFSGLFWGVMLVLFGASMILRAIFNLDIPIFRIVFADCKLPHRNINFFGDSKIETPTYVEGENYLLLNVDVVFGNVVIFEKE